MGLHNYLCPIGLKTYDTWEQLQEKDETVSHLIQFGVGYTILHSCRFPHCSVGN